MDINEKDLFGPPPPPRSLDPINPNPLCTLSDLHRAEHFCLMSRGSVEEIRLLGCQIIQSGTRILRMSQASLYTAQILFNQFFARKSFLDHPLMDVVMACVFVAGKVEECIRRARDIVNVFHHLYCLIRKLPAHPIDYVGDTYYIWRDRLCTTESILLRELGFHVQPASPVGLLLSYLQVLELSSNLELSQTALNYANDALKTYAYVLFQPRIIAASAISLALEHLNLQNILLPPKESLKFPWYTLFDVNETELTECKKIIMTVYNRELDALLPLTKEELAVFASSIKPKERDDTRPKEHESRDSRYKYRDVSSEYRARDQSRDIERESDRYRSRDRESDRYSYERHNDRHEPRDHYNSYNSHHSNHSHRSSHSRHSDL